MSHSEMLSLRKWLLGLLSGVIILGLGQIGLLVYWSGGVSNSITVLKEQSVETKRSIDVLLQRTSKIEGKLGIGFGG